MDPRPPPPPVPKYRLASVVAAVAVFYALCVLFDAKGLHGWASKLPVNERNAIVKKWAARHWKRMAKVGLEEPKHTIETKFLDFKEEHHLLYPKKYEEMIAAKKAKRARKKKEHAEARANPDAAAKAAARKLAESQRFDRDDPDAAAGGPRVLILGDSIMVSVGPVIKKDVDAKLLGQAVVKARVATGLARPDVFDWRRELRDSITGKRFDYIVMMLGTNDSQDFADAGRILYYGTPEWVKTYNERVAGMMDTACQGARKAIWIGLPPMQSPAFNRKVVRINSWAKRQADRFPCVKYMALESVLGDEKGQFAGYRRIADTVEKVRMVDGIHITAKGGHLISDILIDMFARETPEAVAH